MKNLFRSAAFAFILIAPSAICLQLTQAKEESVQSSRINDGSTIQTVQIELKQSITVDELFSEEDSSSFENMILESDFYFDNEAIYDFYIVNSSNQGKNIKEEYVENREAFLKDIKKDMQDEDFNSESVEDLLITKFTVKGKKEILIN